MPNLATQVKKMWPTPEAQFDSGSRGVEFYRSRKKRGKQIGLSGAVKLWSTPMTRDYKDSINQTDRGKIDDSKLAMRVFRGEKQKTWTTPAADDTSHRRNKYKQGGTALSTQAGGQLNPVWVEWIMGYAKHHTNLEKLTELFYGWQEEEQGVPRVDIGIKDRVNRLKALGNAVVPQCVELVGRMILKSGLLEVCMDRDWETK